jgi:hypothetical protein
VTLGCTFLLEAPFCASTSIFFTVGEYTGVDEDLHSTASATLDCKSCLETFFLALTSTFLLWGKILWRV